MSGAAAATLLPVPDPGPDVAVAWVRRHLGDLTAEGPEGVRASPAVRGGQGAADAALAALDVTGYARRRNEVWPTARRGASRMSPYVRHGLVHLPALWSAVAPAPHADRSKYRDELLWQEYARHVYARLGTAMREPLRHVPARGPGSGDPDPWDDEMACMALTSRELHEDGWLVNQTRMWLASQWTVRGGRDWREGEDEFYRHLLDGSRAANRLGWQWTVGAGTGRPYAFSRWQVLKRAPGLCDTCPLVRACPIEDRPDEPALGDVAQDPLLRRDPDPGRTGGPAAVERAGDPDGDPRTVWMTFESMGDADPALAAHPGLPVVAVFDESLLARLRLSGKRLVFLAETLADLALRREVEIHRGDPMTVLVGRRPAVTFAPVPGYRRRAAVVGPVEVHPWPWLVRPGPGPVTSFSAWRSAVAR